MTFAATVWLWLLLLPVLLALIHLLRGARRPRLVSSVALWRGFAVRPLAVRSLSWERPDGALLLGLLILSLLAVAAAAPWRSDASEPIPALAVVVDASSTMATVDDPRAPRRLDLALDAARAVLADHAATPYRLLLAAGEQLQVAASLPGSMESLDEVLDGLEITAGPTEVAQLARSAAALVRTRGGGRVVVISDFTTAVDLPQGSDAGVEYRSSRS